MNGLGGKSAFEHLLYFFFIVVLCLLLGTLVNQGVQMLLGNPEQELSTSRLRLSLFILHAFSFLVPSLIFAILIHRSDFFRFLDLNRRLPLPWILAGITMLFVLMPVIQYSYVLNQMIPLPSWMTRMESETNATIMRMLEMDSPSVLIINLLLMALLPALGEELLFRGVVQKIGYSFFRHPATSVLFTAFLFSAIHFQFEGFLPRFLLGLFLGYLFYWTQHLAVPIIIHFVNNAAMVMVAYVNPDEILTLESPTVDMPLYMVFISLLLLIPLATYFLNIQRSRTS